MKQRYNKVSKHRNGLIRNQVRLCKYAILCGVEATYVIKKELRCRISFLKSLYPSTVWVNNIKESNLKLN